MPQRGGAMGLRTSVWCILLALSAAVPLDYGHGTPLSSGPALTEDEEAQSQQQHQQLVRRESAAARKPASAEPDYHMEVNQIVQSSPDGIDLNGPWTTASGLKINVDGTAVSGPSGSGYAETLTIQNGGRRVQMYVADQKTTFWGTLNGRGSINWNDGDVWTRPIDCVWSPWSLFGACGGPCPQGMQQRKRGFEFLEENQGQPCRGAKEECREAVFCPQKKSEHDHETAGHHLPPPHETDMGTVHD
mmetsp:Transcript_11037/g.24293  ORF Transcript_11037/g.24293 Transcript_11037/m.24293 type:complete len:246 (-) Transcript_11037:130-867(-)|eukprot:CAMPEP_0194778244 /NCGR_PEP_ID=MMETSP0323_2-20130528/67672_1 /TAXON_ID=2866 ORGANISM="Crypthecodinium cohnii, Strain Seligo" /NCGR_SAMPLE_ID=MMETSP0323_2 /ASSEMBLY_ACC=CAM_ASM_000346 /LENGTH=245 /DNA_ID=CAMNT_0039715335 /DNA_START=107 /DNA_END=844 /DNA_ORIENTATION=+